MPEIADLGYRLRLLIQRWRTRSVYSGGWIVDGYEGDHVPRPWNEPTWVPPDRPPGVGDSGVVQLSPEYECELPLWRADWWNLGLSVDLLNDLADWQADFDASFDPEDGGWTSPLTAEQWSSEATRLIGRLCQELPAGVRLEVDVWPLDADT